jgi:2-oxoglutarate dehydrogenase E2 component (dihydrolipoamide succinyltransferase)
MPVDITVPSVGESITEGTLSRWLKKDGDTVQADEPLLELETEKATTPVPAPAAGKLRIKVQEGETVAIGASVGQIDESAAAAKPSEDSKPKAAPAAAPVAAAAAVDDASGRLSPAARRLAEEKGVDVKELAGTGRGGRITKEDVLTHIEQPAEERAKPPADEGRAKPQAVRAEGRETRQRMSAIRQRIAEKLVASQKTTASLTTFNEADLSAVMELRSRYKDRFKEKHGVGLGFMGFFVKAVVEALKAHPQVNGRIDGSDIVLYRYYDIGVAVSTEKGLMVPVLRDCDRQSFGQIEKAIAELAEKARGGKISVNDLQGGTFTITNGGVFGSLLSTPILNPPQSAILGMHTIQKRPVVVSDQVVIRPMMYLALTYDHRLIDGREAVQFLVRVKECIENPERLLLEV